MVNKEARQRIFALTEKLPAVWNDPRTPMKERKRLVAYLIEDVTLLKTEKITAHIRLRSGAKQTLERPLPLNAWQKRTTNAETRRLIDELLEEHDDKQVAEHLNAQAKMSGTHKPFTASIIQWVRCHYGFKSLKERLMDRGMLTTHAMCQYLGINRDALTFLRQKGYLTARTYNGLGAWMYEKPDKAILSKLRSVALDKKSINLQHAPTLHEV